MATEAVSEDAPAKLNLCLHVTGRRADGYHLLDSLVVFADIGDRVTAVAGKGLSLRVTGPEAVGLSTEADNLVLRAAQAMEVGNVALTLEKRLPIASGVGGGSADAAATLRLLARMTGCALPPAVAVLRLGADVPVCLAGRPARMQGIGEQVSPVPRLPEMTCVLVNPRVPVPTPQVFAALQCRENPALPTVPDEALFSATDFASWLRDHSRNDLVTPARLVAPVLEKVEAALQETPGCLLARMSGSGGTNFGLYPTADAATAAATVLRARHPEWWVKAGRILE
jgi:4-diphosphocytidyl-2-C-methyl-D-erythritol kinase